MDVGEGDESESDSESSQVNRRLKAMTSPTSPIVTGVILTDAGEMADSSLHAVTQRLSAVTSPISPIVAGSISKASPRGFGADGGVSAAVDAGGHDRRMDVEDDDDDDEDDKYADGDNGENDDDGDDDNDGNLRSQTRHSRKSTHQNHVRNDSRRMDSTVVRLTDGPASALDSGAMANKHAKKDATGDADAEDLTGSSGSLPLSGSVTSSRAYTRPRSVPLSESVSSGANTWQPDSSSSSSESPTQALSGASQVKSGAISTGQRVPSQEPHQVLLCEQSAGVETIKTEPHSGFSLEPAGAQVVFKMFKRFFDSTPVQVA